MNMNVFEIKNPSFSNMNIEEQIKVGINDWCAEDCEHRQFFGQTKEAAESACIVYHHQF